MRSKLWIAGGITLLLAGCGSPHPCIHGKGGVCLNARTMWGVTRNRDQVNPDKETQREDAQARKLLRTAPTKDDETPNLHPSASTSDHGGGSGNPVAATSSNAVASSTLPAPLHYPRPLISQPKVLQVWVAPYRGPEGNLHFPGMVYSIIHPQTWTLGNGSANAQVPVPVQ